MYYKIVNKKSSVYKIMYEMRMEERKMKTDNEKAIIEKTGLEFQTFLGDSGQQNFRRVPQYIGFKFKKPEIVDLKIWQRDKEYTDIFIPNRRTKDGREMSQFLLNGLQGSRYDMPLNILKVEHERKFTFPFVEISKDDIIVIYLGNGIGEPKNKDVIEITKKEFDKILK